MKSKPWHAVLITVIVITSVIAQETEQTKQHQDVHKSLKKLANSSLETLDGKNLEHISISKLPVNQAKNIALAHQQSAGNLVKNDGLSLLRTRAQQLRKQQVEFTKAVESGELDRYEDFRKKLPSIELQVASLQAIKTQIESGEGDSSELSLSLYEGLQKVGQYLLPADVPDSIATEHDYYSNQQVASLQALEKEVQELQPFLGDSENEEVLLRKIGLENHYTMLFLSVPIHVSAPPGAIVYFSSDLGGKFKSNGLPIVAVKADDDGVARVDWVSEGGAVGEASVLALSDSAANQLTIPVTVVDLAIHFPSLFTR